MAWVLGSCACNRVNAIVNRHGVRQPPVTRNFTDWPRLRQLISSYYGEMHLEISGHWLEKWPLGKRLAILASVAYEKIRPSNVRSFVKREVYHKVPTKARLIQGYFNLSTQELRAREFTTFQKALCRALDDFEISPGIFVTVASGMNADSLARWMTRVSSSTIWFYERDGKNWDATMCLVHHLLKLSYIPDPKLRQFIDACFSVVGFAGRGDVIKYRLEGTVKSGHNDTTSGNSLVNALILVEMCVALGLRGSIIVAGDDALVAVSRGKPDLDSMVKFESELGIIPEARIFFSPLDVSFISGCWLRKRDGFLFVPLLGRLLCRLWWTVNPPSRRNSSNYRFSVVAGLKPACGSVPAYREFLVASDPGGRLIATDKFRHSPYLDCPQLGDEETSSSLCEKYGLLPSELTDLCSFLSTVGSCDFFSHPLVDRVIARDICDISQRSPVATQ